jgi:glyoxylase-like metal-dependent hydrolase (beta-lactamase superfamily II)
MTKAMIRVLIAVLCASMLGAASRTAAPEYSIQAIRYATSPGVPVAELVVGGPKDQKVDIAMVVWLIRGGGRTVLFDSGFHRDTFLKDFPMKEYLPPDEAVKTAGYARCVTDIVISHAHRDHMGGSTCSRRRRCGSSATVPALHQAWRQREITRHRSRTEELVRLNTKGACA